MNCRHCGTVLEHTFLDLGFAPLSNAYLTEKHLTQAEIYYPLNIKVCHQCWLVQTEDYARVEQIFQKDYAYFSSASSTWLAHAADYVEKIIARLELSKTSFVIEVASNDGYLLKNFVAADIPCLGVEPTASTAEAAEKLGIPVCRDFFSEQYATFLVAQGKQADLIVGNNVYAHVPDINDFTRGLKMALKQGGTITLEFPHLMRLIEKNQFDTIYHEHFSYLSLYTVNRIFAAADLRVWDVEELPTHGGSLRVYGCHKDDSRTETKQVAEILLAEKKQGLQKLQGYNNFQQRAENIKNDLLSFLLAQRKQGKKVAAYGAAAKGNTLLNYAGVKPDLLPVVCDIAEAKQGKFLPGSHIPICAPTKLRAMPIDYVIILPWNIKQEVMAQLADLGKHGTKFVTAIPHLEIIA